MATAVALMMGASLGVAPAQSAQSKPCGTYTHGQERDFAIKARGVSCTTARKMIKQWAINVRRRSEACNCAVTRRVVVRGFECLAPGGGLDRLIDCRRPGARVTWHQGALLGSCVYTRSCESSQSIGDRALRV